MALPHGFGCTCKSCRYPRRQGPQPGGGTHQRPQQNLTLDGATLASLANLQGESVQPRVADDGAYREQPAPRLIPIGRDYVARWPTVTHRSYSVPCCSHLPGGAPDPSPYGPVCTYGTAPAG
uniref:Uncharacterized protein n=1 Tax=Pristionchus pacificus TaxID=54126 RepID=A0A8R1YQU5_PRIPA